MILKQTVVDFEIDTVFCSIFMESEILNPEGTGQFSLTTYLSKLDRLSYQQLQFQMGNIYLRSTTPDCFLFPSLQSVARTVPTFRCRLEPAQLSGDRKPFLNMLRIAVTKCPANNIVIAGCLSANLGQASFWEEAGCCAGSSTGAFHFLL